VAGLPHSCRLAALALLLATWAVPPALAAEPLPAPPPGRDFLEYDEAVRSWKLYCRVWPADRRVECDLSARGVNDRRARLVWLRSTERWLDGLRFRADAEALDLSKPIRVWTGKTLFRPEFPCKPFPFETNTCAILDPAVNRSLVERMADAPELSVVGQSPTGAKTEIRFPMAGFKAALDRVEQLRAAAGTPWMAPPPPPAD